MPKANSELLDPTGDEGARTSAKRATKTTSSVSGDDDIVVTGFGKFRVGKRRGKATSHRRAKAASKASQAAGENGDPVSSGAKRSSRKSATPRKARSGKSRERKTPDSGSERPRTGARARRAHARPMPFNDEVARIHDAGRLSEATIAAAVSAAPTTVRDWLAYRSAPSGTRAQRVVILAEVIDRLSRIVDPEFVSVWMVRPIEALGDERPIDLLAADNGLPVLRLISSLEAPVAA